jgi:hypothetical protein
MYMPNPIVQRPTVQSALPGVPAAQPGQLIPGVSNNLLLAAGVALAVVVVAR